MIIYISKDYEYIPRGFYIASSVYGYRSCIIRHMGDNAVKYGEDVLEVYNLYDLIHRMISTNSGVDSVISSLYLTRLILKTKNII